MKRSVDHLIKIASYGGGMRIDGAKFTTDDLVKIVSHAAGKARVFISNAHTKTTDDLVKIASHGKGSVVFED